MKTAKLLTICFYLCYTWRNGGVRVDRGINAAAQGNATASRGWCRCPFSIGKIKDVGQ